MRNPENKPANKKSTKELRSVYFVCVLASTLLITFVFTSSFNTLFASASPVIGVKAGDWAEYTLSGAGALSYVYKERIEVLEVQELNVMYRFISFHSYPYPISITWNETEIITANLNEGTDKTLFIIPAGLTPGDALSDPILGNITVSAAENVNGRMALKADLINAPLNGRGYVGENYQKFTWDKNTGLLIQATSIVGVNRLISYLNLSNTNIWQAQTSPPLFLYMIIASIVIVSATVCVFVWSRIRR